MTAPVQQLKINSASSTSLAEGSLVPISDKGEGKGLAKGLLGRWFTVQERPHGTLERRWLPCDV